MQDAAPSKLVAEDVSAAAPPDRRAMVRVPAIEGWSQRGFDFVLVGCGRAKQLSPDRADELYVSPGFRKRRAIAEAAGGSWYVLSAEYGLVAPEEWLSPYDLLLSTTSADYREAWGRWVVARLVQKRGDLRGSSVLVLAPAPYADPIRPLLTAVGVDVFEPLAGLRQGEQNAVLTREIESRGLPLPGKAQSEPSQVAYVDDLRERQQAVADALLAYRRAFAPSLLESRLGYAKTEDADRLLRSDPFAFLLGVVLDEGITAEHAWQGPFTLMQRLGHLDPWRIRNELDGVRAAVTQRPAIHRYTEIMPEAIVRAADRVCSHYDGDASKIWAVGSTVEDVDARLQTFHRIGPKKAAMAAELLMSHFGVDLGEPDGSNVAYDVHVRRVFLRTGLVEVDTPEAVRAAAKSLHPARPGLIDLPTWLVGRNYCRPTHPQCPECPIAADCPKLIHRNVP